MKETKRHFLDLTNPVHAYLFGLIQADGHLSQDTRNRGKMRIELSHKDADILEKLSSVIPYHNSIRKRMRTTNFSIEREFVCLTVYSKEFRDELVSLGMIYGAKSQKINAPTYKFSQVDYFRGTVDGDGSLGFTSNGFPFLSLCTDSEKLAIAYEAFISKITGKEKRLRRNLRDGIFNIIVFKEDAQTITATLYYEDCVAISRKKQAASDIQAWKRPTDMRRVPLRKFWTTEQDSYILSHTIEESSFALQRTQQSVKMRLWRLHSSNK